MRVDESTVLKETEITAISDDRRSRRRYPMELPMQYKVMRDRLVSGSGTGKVLNMSSKGIAFESSQTLEPGAFVELSVKWPVLLNRCCPLKLVASGRVVRSDAHAAVVNMERYEFRTMGSGQLANAG